MVGKKGKRFVHRSLRRYATEKSLYINSVIGEAGEETTYKCLLRQKSAPL